MPKPELNETIIIYHSPDEGGWIAHGLRTDQIGIDSTPIDALAQVMRLVHALLEEAAADPSITIYCEAPHEIQDLVSRSKPLPRQIAEVAQWKAVGKWPDGWQFQPTKEDESFVVEVDEPRAA